MNKYLIATLALSTFLLSVFAFILWNKLNSSKQQIKDREQVISAYIKVIEAIGRTENVQLNKLKKELEKDFEVSEKPYECCDDGLLYHTLLTKDEEDWRGAGAYMGGIEIITDSLNQLKTLMMWKP